MKADADAADAAAAATVVRANKSVEETGVGTLGANTGARTAGVEGMVGAKVEAAAGAGPVADSEARRLSMTVPVSRPARSSRHTPSRSGMYMAASEDVGVGEREAVIGIEW